MIKTLSSAVNDLLEDHRTKLGQAASKENGVWEGPASQHPGLRMLKDKACKRAMIKEHSGVVDILKSVMGDKLGPEEARERDHIQTSCVLIRSKEKLFRSGQYQVSTTRPDDQTQTLNPNKINGYK